MIKGIGIDIIDIKRTKTRKSQEDMAILTIETTDSIMKAVLFPRIYSKFNLQLSKENIYAFRGELKSSMHKDEEEMSLIVGDVLTEQAICVMDAYLITKKEIDIEDFKEKINKIEFKKGLCHITVFNSELDDELFKLYYHEKQVQWTEEIHNLFLEMGFTIRLNVF